MIENEGKYYLYRHIRLDKNEPFYIGIGTKRKSKAKIRFKRQFKAHTYMYDRAYTKNRTNSPIWHNIIKKTTYQVEIILESNDYEFIRQKEIEFIALYGRIDLKTGILANLTDGGEGTHGHVHKCTEEQREKLRNNSSCKKVVKLDDNYEIIEVYKSTREASRKTGVDHGYISTACREKYAPSKGIVYRYFDDYIKKKSEIGKTESRKIVIYDNKEWVMHKFCKYVESINSIPANTVYERLKRGISPEDCLKLTKK